MNDTYVVTCYNSLDAEFGYDCGPMTIFTNLPKAVAKSIARHMNKVMPAFVSYMAEQMVGREWQDHRRSLL